MQMPEQKTSRTPLHFWVLTGMLALAASILTWVPENPVATFGWLKASPGMSFWRCFSCHFVHLGGRHLLVNLAALASLAAIAGLQEKQGDVTGGFYGALLAGMLGICLGLHALDAGVTWYVGLSGALYGVYAWLVLDMASLRHWRGRVAWGLYCCGMAKALLDAQASVGALGLAGIPLAPPAHLYGLLGGTLWAALRYALGIRRER
jgi:rhomboid family GlyGly-CTERM serine protease